MKKQKNHPVSDCELCNVGKSTFKFCSGKCGEHDSGNNFETDIGKIINNHVSKGLKKEELVKKMEYITESVKKS